MSTEENQIPQHGKAGVAFAGVELSEGWPLIASIFVALPLGKIYSWMFYFAIPLGTFFVVKQYLQWLKNESDDFWTAFAYRFGMTSISPAFDDQKQIFIGDPVIASPRQSHFLKDHITSETHGTHDTPEID